MLSGMRGAVLRAGGKSFVVIDPEDEQQIHELVDAAFKIAAKGTTYADALQSVLRTKAAGAPPKPAEPTNRYSAVVDDEGVEWVRMGVGRSALWLAPRLSPAHGKVVVTRDDYRLINAVEVLSEGVTP